MHWGSSAFRTAKSWPTWFMNILAFAARYSSIDEYLSMWSGVILRIAAPDALNSLTASS